MGKIQSDADRCYRRKPQSATVFQAHRENFHQQCLRIRKDALYHSKFGGRTRIYRPLSDGGVKRGKLWRIRGVYSARETKRKNRF